MSTLSTADSSGNPIDNLQTNSQAFAHTPQSLLYAVTHVFLPDHPPLDRSYPHPLHIPWESDYTPENEHSLTRAVCAAAHAYCTHICEHFEQAQWRRISKMLDNLQASVRRSTWTMPTLSHSCVECKQEVRWQVPCRLWAALTVARYPRIFYAK